jgi:hypothetical protein
MGHRRIAITLVTTSATLAIAAVAARAAIVVFDPALTSRSTTIAALKELLLNTLAGEAEQLRQMATRLSAVTNIHKYWIADNATPTWQSHESSDNRFALAAPYTTALDFGDPNGAAFAAVARDRVDATPVLRSLIDVAPEAEAAIVAQLATLDAADSSLIAGTDQTGQLRYNGRKETAAIDALQEDALDPSSDQSATAVLDKISGAGLVRAQQQQARMQFLAGIVEQLLVDNKRSRDTETATINMQLQRLRWGTAANQSLIAGSGDALRTWQQP